MFCFFVCFWYISGVFKKVWAILGVLLRRSVLSGRFLQIPGVQRPPGANRCQPAAFSSHCTGCSATRTSGLVGGLGAKRLGVLRSGGFLRVRKKANLKLLDFLSVLTRSGDQAVSLASSSHRDS